MGKMVLKPACLLTRKSRKFPTVHTETRANAGTSLWIVIPVVVGSSPISHPNIHAGYSLISW